jgi:hypothetical protein
VLIIVDIFDVNIDFDEMEPYDFHIHLTTGTRLVNKLIVYSLDH